MTPEKIREVINEAWMFAVDCNRFQIAEKPLTDGELGSILTEAIYQKVVKVAKLELIEELERAGCEIPSLLNDLEGCTSCGGCLTDIAIINSFFDKLTELKTEITLK